MYARSNGSTKFHAQPELTDTHTHHTTIKLDSLPLGKMSVPKKKVVDYFSSLSRLENKSRSLQFVRKKKLKTKKRNPN